MSYTSSFETAGAVGQISSQTSNISFLGLRPARGGDWGKRGIQKIFWSVVWVDHQEQLKVVWL